MNFQQACEELKKIVGKELEPVLVTDFSSDRLREVDCGARQARMDGEKAWEMYERLKPRLDRNVQLAVHSAGVIIGESDSQWDLLWPRKNNPLRSRGFYGWEPNASLQIDDKHTD